MDVPYAHQAIMFFAGLRGAIAFSLAMDLRTRVDENGNALLSTTLVIVLLTVAVLGGGTKTLLDLFKIPMGVDYEATEKVRTKTNFWKRIDDK